jgi:alkylresorcinol/alkylpyrone synthase
MTIDYRRPVETALPQPHRTRVSSDAEGAPIRVAATATALPEHVLDREGSRAYLQKVFPMLGDARTGTMLEVIENAKIDRRYFIFPIDYTVEPRPLQQTSREYLEHSVRLGRQVAADCLKRAHLAPTDVDLLITVSCTGVIIPSLDAHLVNDLGFRSDVRRLPITELGCAGGAAALGRAWDYLRGVPEGVVLIVAVELPSLTFQRRDVSPANLISAVLFGDGAAAAAITRGKKGAANVNGGAASVGTSNGNSANGDSSHPESAKPGPRIVGSKSHLFPNTIDAMGFDLKDGGFHIVLSKDVPQLIRENIRAPFEAFLAEQGLQRSDLKAFVLHPGGQKLLQYMEDELGLDRSETQFSWDVLRDYGNLSSASVLFVLHEWLRKGKVAAGSHGLLAAFGPGFSAEMLLLEWA